jgi:hypothetical protein
MERAFRDVSNANDSRVLCFDPQQIPFSLGKNAMRRVFRTRQLFVFVRNHLF